MDSVAAGFDFRLSFGILMNALISLLTSSLGKKYIMALTGLALALFVFVHMAGNLQTFTWFGGVEGFNAYAHKLQSLPGPILWGFRFGLLAVVAIHVWAAITLTLTNKRARTAAVPPQRIQASRSSKVMPYTGVVLLLFIIIHILHFTTKSIYDYGALPKYEYHGELVPDAFTMVMSGFSHWWVSAFYLFCMALLCSHLAHGVASMFQSLGLRNEAHRYWLEKASLAYGWIIFLGFAAIPVGVLLTLTTGLDLMDESHYRAVMDIHEANKAAAEVAANLAH